MASLSLKFLPHKEEEKEDNIFSGSSNDSNVSQSSSDMICDQLTIMIRQEKEKDYLCCDYIKKYNDANKLLKVRQENKFPLDDECRIRMCEWCYRLMEYCKFSRQIVSRTFSYLDLFLSTQQGQEIIYDRRLYQLTVMTCLFISIKIHETITIDIKLLTYLSMGTFVAEEFSKMETKILNALQWKVHKPIPIDFIRSFIYLLPTTHNYRYNNKELSDTEGRLVVPVDISVQHVIMDLAQYQVELAVSKYNLVTYLSSDIALAAVLNSIRDIDNEYFTIQTKKYYINKLEKSIGINIHTNITKILHLQEELELLVKEQLRKNHDNTKKNSTSLNTTPAAAATTAAATTSTNTTKRNPSSCPSMINKQQKNVIKKNDAKHDKVEKVQQQSKNKNQTQTEREREMSLLSSQLSVTSVTTKVFTTTSPASVVVL